MMPSRRRHKCYRLQHRVHSLARWCATAGVDVVGYSSSSPRVGDSAVIALKVRGRPPGATLQRPGLLHKDVGHLPKSPSKTVDS